MNRRTLPAILVLVFAFWFFNTPFWYNLMGQQHPSEFAKEQVERQTDQLFKEQPEMVEEVVLDETPLDAIVEDLAPAIEVVLESDLLRLTLSEEGGVIRSARVLDYLYRPGMPLEGEPVELLALENSAYGELYLNGRSLASTRFIYDSTLSGSLSASFRATLPSGDVVRTYTLDPESYYIQMTLSGSAVAGSSVTYSFPAGINETESFDGRSEPHSLREVVAHDGRRTTVKKFSRRQTEDLQGVFRWAGMSSKYFATAIILPKPMSSTLSIESFPVDIGADKVDEGPNMNYSIALTFPASEDDIQTKLFLGPGQIEHLREAGVKLDKMVFRGWGVLWADSWFPAICNFVVWLMGIFYAIFKDYGVAILLLTLVLKAVTFPLTQSSMKSMERMKLIQPKIKAIQDKYKNNPQLMQAKMMEFYKEEGVNPLASLGGCLPMFLQMPIMIALFVVLRKAVELRGATTVVAPWLSDLSQPEVIFELPFSIPMYGSHFAFLPLLMAGLMFLQNKMTMKDPAQQGMVYIMPVVMLVMFNNFPSGLTLYFVFSNLLQMLQQRLVVKATAEKSSKAVVVD